MGGIVLEPWKMEEEWSYSLSPLCLKSVVVGYSLSNCNTQ